MIAPSRQTPAQLADAIERRDTGRPDPAAMTSEQRRAAGLMDLEQAAAHEHLTVLPHARLAERCRGPVPGDIWVTPQPGDPPEYEPADEPDDGDWASYLAAGHDEAAEAGAA